MFNALNRGTAPRGIGLNLLDLAPDDALALGVEAIGTMLQKQQAEDVILISRRVQALLPEPVGGAVKMTFELGEQSLGMGFWRLRRAAAPTVTPQPVPPSPGGRGRIFRRV